MNGSNKKLFIERNSVKSDIYKNLKVKIVSEPFLITSNDDEIKPFLSSKSPANDNSFISPNEKTIIDLINNNNQIKENNISKSSKDNSRIYINFMDSRLVNADVISNNSNKRVNNLKKTHNNYNNNNNKILNKCGNSSFLKNKLRKSFPDEPNTDLNENQKNILVNAKIENFNKANPPHQISKSLNRVIEKELITFESNPKINKNWKENNQKAFKSSDLKNYKRFYEPKSVTISEIVRSSVTKSKREKNHHHFNQSLRSYHKEIFYRKNNVLLIKTVVELEQVNNGKEEPQVEEIIGIL